MTARRATPELDALLALFYADGAELAEFDEVPEDALPVQARELLAHDQHMTVTVEAAHDCAVRVEVLAKQETATHYARKIVLRRQTDDAVVLFGIVRLALASLDPDVRAEIESQSAPLGHILIKHNVLRTVRLLSLWRLVPSDELQELFGSSLSPGGCFGRTALIYCDGVPAVELLEVVAAAAN